MKARRPFIVTLLGDGCIMSALFVLATLFPKILERIGIESVALSSVLNLSILPDYITKISLILILIFTGYGYLKLKKWGYWSMVSINVYFILEYLIYYYQRENQIMAINPLTNFIGLYLGRVRLSV